MKRNNFRLIMSGISILIAIMACDVPGLAPQTAPTTDPNSISTFVAGTAQVLAQQTVQAYLTPTPLPEPPTAAPPPTATPEVSALGTSLVVRDDQSVVFTDTQAGYELTIPPGWLAVRPNEKEYYEALSSPAVANNPVLQQLMNTIAKEDPKTNRLFAFVVAEGYQSDKFISAINLIVAPGDTTIEQDMRDLGLKIQKSEITTNASGFQVGIIDLKWPGQSANGETIEIFQRHFIFKPKNATVAIIFSTLNEIKDKTLTLFDPIIDTIKLTY